MPFSRHSSFARALTVIKFSIGSDHFPPSTPGDKLLKCVSSHAHFAHPFNQPVGCPRWVVAGDSCSCYTQKLAPNSKSHVIKGAAQNSGLALIDVTSTLHLSRPGTWTCTSVIDLCRPSATGGRWKVWRHAHVTVLPSLLSPDKTWSRAWENREVAQNCNRSKRYMFQFCSTSKNCNRSHSADPKDKTVSDVSDVMCGCLACKARVAPVIKQMTEARTKVLKN